MSGSLGNGRVWRRDQKGGAVFVGDWTGPDGKRHRKALSSDRRVAQRMLADIVRRRDLCVAGLEAEEGLDLAAEEIIGEFLADLRSRRSPGYCARVETVLRNVQAGMQVRRMRDYQPQSYLLFRRRRLATGVSNRTANMDLTVVRTFINWTTQVGYLGFNPLQPVRPLPAGKAYEKHPRRALSEQEIETFVAAAVEMDRRNGDRIAAVKTIEGGTKPASYAAQDRPKVVPQAPLWLTLLETGMRFGEASLLTWGDLSEPNRALTLRAKTTKARRERVIPVRPELVEVLLGLRLAHLEVRGRMPTAGDPIFLTSRGHPWADNRRNALRMFREVLKLAGC